VVVEELSREELRQVIINRFPLLEPLIEKILRQASHPLFFLDLSCVFEVDLKRECNEIF
jgi:hypothetical protein